MALGKRKMREGPSGSPQWKTQGVEPRASTLPPSAPIVDFVALETSEAIAQPGGALVMTLLFILISLLGRRTLVSIQLRSVRSGMVA